MRTHSKLKHVFLAIYSICAISVLSTVAADGKEPDSDLIDTLEKLPLGPADLTSDEHKEIHKALQRWQEDEGRELVELMVKPGELDYMTLRRIHDALLLVQPKDGDVVMRLSRSIPDATGDRLGFILTTLKGLKYKDARTIDHVIADLSASGEEPVGAIKLLEEFANQSPSLADKIGKAAFSHESYRVRVFSSAALFQAHGPAEAHTGGYQRILKSVFVQPSAEITPVLFAVLSPDFWDAADRMYILPRLCLHKNEAIAQLARKAVAIQGSKGLAAIKRIPHIRERANDEEVAMSLLNRAMGIDKTVSAENIMPLIRLGLNSEEVPTIEAAIGCLETKGYESLSSNLSLELEAVMLRVEDADLHRRIRRLLEGG